ncbi:MAG: hypothetical protein LW860_09390 [Xanthomonadaceae bacterium]|nr:hypothetical protein [Xanthomonadaceae bacterium]
MFVNTNLWTYRLDRREPQQAARARFGTPIIGKAGDAVWDTHNAVEMNAPVEPDASSA